MSDPPVIAAAQRHGPPHVLVLGILAVAVIGWLIYRAVNGRKRSKDHTGGRGRER